MKNWQILISGGINPYLKKLLQDKIIDGVNIELNNLNGDNIRLALHSKISTIKPLKSDFHNLFSNLFSSDPIYRDLQFRHQGLMPFPPNTIYYDLYNLPSIHPKRKNHYIDLYTRISQIILDSLQDAEIDNETILTVAFYLNLALLKCMFQKESQDPSFQPAFVVEKPESVRKDQADSMIFSMFDQNKETFQEIAFDVLSSSNPETDEMLPPWMAKWCLLCTNDVEKETQSGEEVEYATRRTYHRISYLIKRNLGISETVNGALQYFMSLILFEAGKNIFLKHD